MFVTGYCFYKVNAESILCCGLSMLQMLMLNDRIQSISRLQSALAKAEDHLTKLPPETPYSEFEYV